PTVFIKLSSSTQVAAQIVWICQAEMVWYRQRKLDGLACEGRDLDTAVKDVACEVGSKFGCNSSSPLAAITWSYVPLKKASMEELEVQPQPVVFGMDKMANVVKWHLREMATLLDGSLTLDTALPDLNLDDWGTKVSIVEWLQEPDGHRQLLVHTVMSPNTALSNMLFLLNLLTGLPTLYLQSADSYMLDYRPTSRQP
ncbi:hypothetical protein JCM1840_000800, partial [Sporobolomyces johnsonii]